MKNKHRFNSSQETQQTTKHDSLVFSKMSSSVKCVCRLLYLNQYFVKSITHTPLITILKQIIEK